MKRTILVGAAAFALLGGAVGTAAAEGIPLTAQNVDITPGSAADLGNAIGTGSVDTGSTAAALGSAFGGGYAGGVLGSLSAH
ncbi:hypothetical protein [Nocardia sp. NBC_01327]|uniref:hypothetical protein n=1 Tax=Nocardia sp. NBC_01327 TaxID=2903593 RepID=UPI002E14D68D|nr:hypothetical protein OG326_15715 [Nocardia sp. NBC_01327]